MSRKKINPSWETFRDNKGIHSPQGVDDLRESLRNALIRRYTGLAETMWQYDLSDPVFEDMNLMSRNMEPERTLMTRGQGVWFSIPETGQWHFLPFVGKGGINIYGQFNQWTPLPVGSESIPTGQNSSIDAIRALTLDSANSVIMKDNLYGQSDYAFIESAVGALVDDMLTINQLTLLAKSPFIFRVNKNNILDAKNFFLALSTDRPAIFKYDDVEDMEAVIEQTNVTIDTGLFDVFRHWENTLLEQLGIPGSQLTQKRAQQTVDEVTMGEDMVSLRRHEKLRERQLALERLNAMAGTNVTVISVIDSIIDDMEDKDDDIGQPEE